MQKLPDNSQGYFCSKYKDEIEQFQATKERLWIGTLSKSLFEDIVIEKGNVLKFLCSKQTKKFTVKHETKTTCN